MTQRAREVLEEVNVVVGYATYIDLIRPLLRGKQIVSTGMTKEVDRVEKAIDIACQGKSCAVVSSGDPGIYAMAGLVLETCRLKNIPVVPAAQIHDTTTAGDFLKVEIVPGVPALGAGAALLGAPLTHDFAAISLSDLLTPWEVIAARLEAAAKADFVVVLYNPKSKKRNWQFEEARRILMKHRDKHTPVGIAKGAMRDDQQVRIVTLENLQAADVDMQTTVFVGNSATFRYLDFMITPRGYSQKYEIGGSSAKSQTVAQ